MLKLIVGTTLVLLFLYMARLLFQMTKVARKKKELISVQFDEEVAELDKEIQERRKRLDDAEFDPLAPRAETNKERYGL